jgi:hypothetical protein
MVWRSAGDVEGYEHGWMGCEKNGKVGDGEEGGRRPGCQVGGESI